MCSEENFKNKQKRWFVLHISILLSLVTDYSHLFAYTMIVFSEIIGNVCFLSVGNLRAKIALYVNSIYLIVRLILVKRSLLDIGSISFYND